MKKWLIACFLVGAAASWAAPTRVALLDFEDLTGMPSDARLGGALEPGALAGKGVSLLGKQLVQSPEYVLIDRRDFINQVDKLRLTDDGSPTPTKPSFLQAAQALRTDVVLRGNLLSFSTGKQVVDQGGYRTEFSTVSLRVSLEALDTVDGAVVAVSDGVAREKVRQTAETQTELGEEEIVVLMEEAIRDALPELQHALAERQAQQGMRETVKLSITTSDDPALVEIDGILVGTTPLEAYQVYKGDHVMTIGKAGHYDVTKRILFEKDTAIEVPLIRVKLTADEIKEVLEKARLHIFEGEPGLIIHEIQSTE